MASAVEVISQAEGVPAAQVALDGKVRLLRIGIHEISGLRISEGLEAQRQERSPCEVEIVLIQKNRIGSIRD